MGKKRNIDKMQLVQIENKEKRTNVYKDFNRIYRIKNLKKNFQPKFLYEYLRKCIESRNDYDSFKKHLKYHPYDEYFDSEFINSIDESERHIFWEFGTENGFVYAHMSINCKIEYRTLYMNYSIPDFYNDEHLNKVIEYMFEKAIEYIENF